MTTTQNLTREQRLIELVKQISKEELIGDDCAVVPGKGLLSSDMLVEGQHFLLPQMNLGDLGWKSMAVNLSDIAAMAGKAEYALVNIALPASLSEEDFIRLYTSINECGSKYGARIIGGDLTASKALVISITVMGSPHPSGAIMRSGAHENNLVLASGDFGASGLGLELILRGEKADSDACHPLRRHLRPEPRLKEAEELAEISSGCSSRSLMDTSDGLADALLQTAAASGVSIEIDARKIPIHDETKEIAARLNLDPVDLALYGGEDYELLACVPESVWERLSKKTNSFKLIGRVGKGNGVSMQTENGAVAIEAQRTFQHWKP